MRHEVDYVYREIELTMSEDEARDLYDAIDQLRTEALASPTAAADAALNNLLAEFAEAHAELNAPTACCGRVLRGNHPGCACLLEHVVSDAWDRVAEGAERAKNQPSAAIHYTTLANRIDAAREASQRLDERRKAISDFEKENDQ